MVSLDRLLFLMDLKLFSSLVGLVRLPMLEAIRLISSGHMKKRVAYA